MSIHFLLSVTHRGVTADHYREGKKYMIWFYKAGSVDKDIGTVQVRGIHEPLTKAELKKMIDGLWQDYYTRKKEGNI